MFYKLLRDHRCQPRVLYTAELSIKINEDKKPFYDTNNFKHYLSTNPTLQKH